LILDEPTSAIDAASESWYSKRSIADERQDFAGDRARLATVQRADVIFVL